jgi:hypothetical protein
MFVLFCFGFEVGSTGFYPRLFIFIFGFEFCLFFGLGVGNKGFGLGLLYCFGFGFGSIGFGLALLFIHIFKNNLNNLKLICPEHQFVEQLKFTSCFVLGSGKMGFG